MMAATNIHGQPGYAGKKSVFVVDDHPLLRQGLALLINQQQDLEVCGEAEEAVVVRDERLAVQVAELQLDSGLLAFCEQFIERKRHGTPP